MVLPRLVRQLEMLKSRTPLAGKGNFEETTPRICLALVQFLPSAPYLFGSNWSDPLSIGNRPNLHHRQTLEAVPSLECYPPHPRTPLPLATDAACQTLGHFEPELLAQTQAVAVGWISKYYKRCQCPDRWKGLSCCERYFAPSDFKTSGLLHLKH